jgi:hypothetical protein
MNPTAAGNVRYTFAAIEYEEGRQEAFGVSKLLNFRPAAWLTLTQASRSRTVVVA